MGLWSRDKWGHMIESRVGGATPPALGPLVGGLGVQGGEGGGPRGQVTRPLLQRVGWQTPPRVEKAARVMAARELRQPEVVEREGPRAS